MKQAVADNKIRLTEYSHGAGCGCKIAPEVLDRILAEKPAQTPSFPFLKVGNDSRDDAAVIEIENGPYIISTTDFFMPIVDDPFSFGQIAAANAISDIYAMGGTPLMAIAILGWPVKLLGPEIAARVVSGGRSICHEAGIPLAGGHSIDAPEPVFGLAVTGTVQPENLRRNSSAKEGDLLFLTKPLGIGILSTAQKQKKLLKEHAEIAPNQMKTLNKVGSIFATLPYVHAMTDVTGFGLLGHLLEVCEGSRLGADIMEADIPVLDEVNQYLASGCIPGGTLRNHASYKNRVPPLSDNQKAILCDPQTSGGLLVTVAPDEKEAFLQVAQTMGLHLQCFGQMKALPAPTEPTINIL